MTINTYHSSKWKMVMSNVPSISTYRDINSMYENWVKSITLPDINIEYLMSDFKTYSQRSPISKINNNLTPIIAEFKVNEDLTNYLNLVELMQQLKYGENLKDDLLKKTTIDTLSIIFLDNQKRETCRIYFTKCFIDNLSSLPLTMGDDSEITFTVSIAYEEMFFETLGETINN